MTRAGHRNMSTTQVYLHLAGVVFREEAATLADRLLGLNVVPNRYQPELTSPHQSVPEPTETAGS